MVHGQTKRLRRTQFIIHKRFQLQYMGIILLISIFIMAIASTTVYLTSYKILKEKMASVYPQNELVPILRHTHVILARNLVLLVPIIIVMAVYLSHKIAGPLYRIEKSIREIGSGNYDLKVVLRHGDEFKEIADAVNDMTDMFRELRKKDLDLIYRVKNAGRQFVAKLEEIHTPVDPKELAQSLRKEIEYIESMMTHPREQGQG